MKASQVQLKLLEKLPKYSSLFSSNLEIVSLTRSGSTATAIASEPHGLYVGAMVNITGAIIKNPIISLTRIGNIATAITEYDHDLTEGYNATITVQGADQPEYNGEYALKTVPNRRTFTYQIEGEPVTPASGTIFLYEVDRSINPYNGLKAVTEVPSPTVFKYSITPNVYSPAAGEINGSWNMRIGGAMSLEKADEWYSKQGKGKFWLFVVLSDRSASKDRRTEDDAVATTPTGTRYQQRVIAPVSCYVFAPLLDDTTPDGVNGRKLRDTMEDVFFALCKSLLRTKFETEFSSGNDWSELMFVNHGFFHYNQAYYIHQYVFENTFEITWDDTIDPSDNVAFRDIELDFQRVDDDYILAHAAINLDDVPL